MGVGKAIRVVRLASGLVLMTFVAGHLANLAIGIHSLAAMEAWRATLVGPWKTGLGQLLLATAATVHVALGLYAIGARRSLALSRTDAVQLVLGLVTPPLLVAHVVAMVTTARVVPEFTESYALILAVYWSFAPAYAFQQLVVVVVVWIHAAVGLYSYLVLQPVWRRIGGFVLPLLFAVPILALVGFAESGKEVLAKLDDPAWRAQIIDVTGRVAKVTRGFADGVSNGLLAYGLLVALALCVLALRILRDRRIPVQLAYDGGLRAEGRRGLSILELSRLNDVPHAHVCSGRGRCGTCRVHVDAGAPSLSPILDEEQATLDRVHAGAGVRLACQARVLGPGVAVTRLLPAFADASAARDPESWNAPPPVPEQAS
jgi:adenylate cyclase